MTPITIVLPTFDRRHVLERTVGSYLRLATRCTLLVVDDGSHDGTAGWLRDQGVRVLRHPRRQGLPSARNTGLRAAQSDWVLFGEDDVIMPEDHPELLLAEALRLPHCGAVAGRLFAGTSWTLPSERPMDSPRPLLDGRRCVGDFAAPLPGPRALPTLHACALIDRRAALAVGGYDSAYTGSAFREDSDFYARLWRSGRSCWLTPATWAVHVRHRLGGGCRGRSGIGAKLANRASYWCNNARFLDRHQRLWRAWIDGPTPGIGKVNEAWAIIRQAIAASGST